MMSADPSPTLLIEDNEPLVSLLRGKREQLQAEAQLLHESGEEKRADAKLKYLSTIDKAWYSVCDQRTAITTVQEAARLKHVGPWILRILDPFFEEKRRAPTQQPASQPLGTNMTGANGRAKRKYIPAKNSGGYALLITLLRALIENKKKFMMKKELMDEADKSGLSTKPIRDNAVPWTGGQPNAKDLYSGWSSMTTLIRNSLVIKSSNPAKYQLTDEGESVARQCMDRAGLTLGNSSGHEISREEEQRVSPVRQKSGECSFGRQESLSSDEDVQEIRRSDLTSQDKRRRKDNSHIPSSPTAVGVYDLTSQRISLGNSSLPAPPVAFGTGSEWMMGVQERTARADRMDLSRNNYGHCSMQASRGVQGNVTPEIGSVDPEFELAVPPLEVGEKFSDVYEIICILDTREQIRKKKDTQSQKSVTQLQDFAKNLRGQFEVKVETRQLPVGDTLWIARHKQQQDKEYVLEFVLERKSVQDLWHSIKDNRYKQQKLRLMNCGLKRLLYLVEGDVNFVESTEALKTAYEPQNAHWLNFAGSTKTLKTAMFTTELEGFRLLRTDDTHDTCKQYGHLTKAIISRYSAELGNGGKSGQVSKTYKVFVEHCRAFEKDRVKDVFCRQLTQIAQVTEEIACSIQDRYPTLSSIAAAFEKLEGNQEAQEKLLHGIPIRNTSKTISSVMSKNVYKVIWGPLVP